MKTWNIILCDTLAEAQAAQVWITTNWPEGTTVYFEKNPPIAPNSAGMNVAVWEFKAGVIVLRAADPGNKGPFYILHAISP